MSDSLLVSVNSQGATRWGGWARASAFFVWGVLALSVVFWGLRLEAGRPRSSLTTSVVRLPEPADPLLVARLLGASGGSGEAVATAAPSRLVLTGVVAGVWGGGAALIAVGEDPPQPFRVGSRVREDLLLQSVRGRLVQLGPALRGPTTLTLELPALEPAAEAARP